MDGYRGRLRYLNRASLLLCWVMVLAVLISSISLIYPDQKWVAAPGAACLLAALLLDVGAVWCVVAENGIDRRAIEAEALDLDEADSAERATQPQGQGA